MNRSNVPYIVATALLVLAIGGWGIFLTGGNHSAPTDSPDAGGADAGTSDSGMAGTDAGEDAGQALAPDAASDSGSQADAAVALAPPPRAPDAGTLDAGNGAGSASPNGPATNGNALAAQKGASGPKKKGAISADVVRSVVAGMKPAMKLCYESLLEEFPGASGDVLVSFRIEAEGADGRVTIVEVDEKSTLMDDKLLTCLTDAFGDAVFPVPDGGDTVQVTYPFKFATK